MSGTVTPAFALDAFSCPVCGAYADQAWGQIARVSGRGHYFIMAEWHCAQCRRCNEYSIWHREGLVWPSKTLAPQPNPDLPGDVLALYREADAIAGASPRAAAALLRLALERLAAHVGGEGARLDDRIGSLSKKGLPERVIRAMDVVRIAGNNAVHPGEIDLHEKPDTVAKMFVFINMVADYSITKEREVNALFDQMPEGAKKAALKRDENRG